MDALLWVPVVACGAALLTFFSGFGLGTLLMAALLLYYPPATAIALTAVVHLLNNLFKYLLLRQHIHPPTLLRFGLPALLGAVLGAWLLQQMSTASFDVVYTLFGYALRTTVFKMVVGMLMLFFALWELVPALRDAHLPPQYMPWGGALSGLLGGFSGHQGALRTAFLARSGLGKEQFMATGVAIACGIDVARLAVYGTARTSIWPTDHVLLMGLTVLAAWAGSWLGSRWLRKITLLQLQRLVAVLLALLAALLMLGLV